MRNSGPGVGEGRGRRGQRQHVEAKLARRARGAVLRVLEVADEIVMLERRRDEDSRIQRKTDHRQQPRPDAGTCASHLFDDTPFTDRPPGAAPASAMTSRQIGFTAPPQGPAARCAR